MLRAGEPSPHICVMAELLHSVREGRILRLTLNRPEKRNALDAALCRALVDALEGAEQDSAVGAILLAANGKAFCAGMDLGEIGRVDDTSEIDEVQERLFTVGARLTKPIVAAVHGAAPTSTVIARTRSGCWAAKASWCGAEPLPPMTWTASSPR